ncbi:MAG TPA: SCO family protein [Minicystis sp.]|nr:SCO family protein [Minicystis sp.]
MRAGRFVSNLVARPAFWLVALAICFVVPLGRALALGRNAPHSPSLSMPLPAFQLTDERGQPFGSKDLAGRVWVADFVFTSCPSVCPKLTEKMAMVQHRSRNLGDAFHLVTFTVDPENDTPERLAEYARRYHASPRWSFLTGANKAVEETVVKGFKIAMGKEETSPGSGIFSIFHGERFVLVDQRGNIRGYYDADDAGIDALMRDVGLIANGR